eukprot:8651967-Alexandrium_andersonii.AAC.1
MHAVPVRAHACERLSCCGYVCDAGVLMAHGGGYGKALGKLWADSDEARVRLWGGTGRPWGIYGQVRRSRSGCSGEVLGRLWESSWQALRSLWRCFAGAL